MGLLGLFWAILGHFRPKPLVFAVEALWRLGAQYVP
jgi:hypothetical protein